VNWQPIETAPRDGTEILVWSEKECFSVIWRGKGWFIGFNDIYGDFIHVNATHWMPLPPHPTD
jgi:hypothetical protein